MQPKDETTYQRLETTYYSPSTGQVTDRVSADQVLRNEVVEQTSVNGDKHAPNAYSYVARRYDYPVGNSIGVNSSSQLVEERQGCFGPVYSFSFTGMDDQEDQLANSALSELNQRGQGGMDLSTDLLEFHQVLTMIRKAGSIHSYLGNTLRAAKARGKGVKADTTVKQLVRDAGGNWLQWKLGLSPLLGSFHDIVKEVNTSVVLRAMRIRAMRKTPIVASGFADPNAISRITDVSNVRGVQGVDIRVQYRPNQGFDITRWVSLNPVGWAWELIPYSFVVDYFYNIGDFVRNSEIALAYANSFDSGYVTYLYAYGGPLRTNGFVTSNGVTSRYQLNGAVSVKRFRRRVLAGWPFPRAPTFQSNLGSGQMLNIAALLSQHLKR